MKCSICKNKIERTFLNKIIGTYIRQGKELYAVCFECQKKFKTKENMLKNIKQ